MKIAPSFHIPAGYKKSFMLSDKDSGYSARIDVDADGIDYGELGKCNGRLQSLVLDWMQYSIEFVRHDLGV